MQIADRAALWSVVRDWSARRDLSDNALTLITELAERRMDQDLRVPELVVRAYGYMDADFQTLPAEYQEMKRVTYKIRGKDILLDYADNEQIYLLFPDEAENEPRVYSIVGHQIQFRPRPAEAYEYEITFYRIIPPLTGAASTNAILDEYPMVYLYAMLVEVATYLKDDEQVTRWAGMYSNIVDMLSKAELRKRHPTTPRMSIRRSRRFTHAPRRYAQ